MVRTLLAQTCDAVPAKLGANPVFELGFNEDFGGKVLDVATSAQGIVQGVAVTESVLSKIPCWYQTSSVSLLMLGFPKSLSKTGYGSNGQSPEIPNY